MEILASRNIVYEVTRLECNIINDLIFTSGTSINKNVPTVSNKNDIETVTFKLKVSSLLYKFANWDERCKCVQELEPNT